jgi:hypothetical protein
VHRREYRPTAAPRMSPHRTGRPPHTESDRSNPPPVFIMIMSSMAYRNRWGPIFGE